MRISDWSSDLCSSDLVAAKGSRARRHVVGENPVAALAIELEARMLDHLFGLRGKADDEARALAPGLRQLGQDVRVLRQLERGGQAVVFLQLVLGDGGYAPVGDGRGAHGDPHRPARPAPTPQVLSDRTTAGAGT